MCGEESAALDLAPSEVLRLAPAPPAAAGGTSPPGGSGDGQACGASTVCSCGCVSGRHCLVFPWEVANFLSFISKLEIRGGVSQNFSAVKCGCID